MQRKGKAHDVEFGHVRSGNGHALPAKTRHLGQGKMRKIHFLDWKPASVNALSHAWFMMPTSKLPASTHCKLARVAFLVFPSAKNKVKEAHPHHQLPNHPRRLRPGGGQLPSC